MTDFKVNIEALEDQGLMLIHCQNCGRIYYDLRRRGIPDLHCTYCGQRFSE